ncbi:hypothetical protein HPB48_024445 [Haemaphysalis longicornis]|uniref:5'-deoxynucleotidase HDDC2 n=1 Tax=Haemaphysalis longicornis TaxID=44386 RepID=A0A9J6H9C5_HAELO|nr:hypothetical protein HPB48_024445 [Haemaphysalis longicornis]
MIGLRRTGWVLRGVPDPERVSGHMYRMAVMAMMIGNDPNGGIDKDKCIRMALVHDMGECIVGDITPQCGVSKEHKLKLETEAMASLGKLVDSASAGEFRSLWEEENPGGAVARLHDGKRLGATKAQRGRLDKGHAESISCEDTAREVLIVGDTNASRLTRALQRQLGADRRKCIQWCHVRRVRADDIKGLFSRDQEDTSRRARLVVLHTGLTDVLDGAQPDDIVEGIRESSCTALTGAYHLLGDFLDLSACTGGEGRIARDSFHFLAETARMVAAWLAQFGKSQGGGQADKDTRTAKDIYTDFSSSPGEISPRKQQALEKDNAAVIGEEPRSTAEWKEAQQEAGGMGHSIPRYQRQGVLPGSQQGLWNWRPHPPPPVALASGQYHPAETTSRAALPSMEIHQPPFPQGFMSTQQMPADWRLFHMVGDFVRQHLGVRRPRGHQRGQDGIRVGFLNLNGGRRELKWTELYRTLREDDIPLFAVAETHLRELEEPPAHSDWCWAGCNRAGQGRKGGGIGFLWRRDLQWRRQEGACSDHLWVFGDLRGIPVAVCVVYLAVNTKHRDENVQSLECVRRDARQWATDRELIILGDFNGHLSELDGHTDFNGRLVLGLAEDMQLSILNLDQRCVGQVTWCARGSTTTIDYALISHGLDSACRMCTVDGEGLRSVGSDHNRLCLQFEAAGFRKRKPQRKDRGKYLPSAAVGKVCEDFEVSPRRHAATSYEDFVQALREVIERHMVQDRRSDEARKNPWWDEEVETAWRERRRANRAHRLAIKTGCAEAVPAMWAQYIELKRKVQALVQAKLAEHNMSLFRSLHSDGKSTAQRFWRYVTSLDRPAPPPWQLRDVASGRSILNLKEHLTEHFTRVFQDPDPSADLCGGQKEDIPPDSTSARSREESTHYAFSGASGERLEHSSDVALGFEEGGSVDMRAVARNKVPP